MQVCTVVLLQFNYLLSKFGS